MKLLLTGYPGWFTHRFLETLPHYPDIFSSVRVLALRGASISSEVPKPSEIVSGDLLDPVSLEDACKGMDVIVHAAGVLHVKRNRDFYRINRDGTANLLEAAVKQKVEKFIYISSNAAQGFCKGRGHELDETLPDRPTSHYGKSKYHGEQVVKNYQSRGLIQTVILRPAMFYGPPVPVRHVQIYKRILYSTFPVFGSGDYLRSITHIDHLVQGVHLAIAAPHANGQTYYIADKEIPTLNQILQAMADALGCKLRVVRFPKFLTPIAEGLDLAIAALGGYWMEPHLVGESAKNIACRIDKAENELGFKPILGYRDGYRDAIRWCRDRGLLE